MNKIKYLFLALMTMFAFASCSSDDDDKVITLQDLPAQAQTFLTTHFSGLDATRVEQEGSTDSPTYSVRLSDNTEIDFDQQGQWTEVDCKTKAVPAAIIPQGIADYVAANYSDLTIVQIDKEPYGYEIELSNDLDLKFDQQQNILTA